MGDADETYIVDGEAASGALARMAARATFMGEKLQALADDIGAHEVGKPWGRAEEYGGRFEHVYDAGGNGAEFVRSNIHLLAEQTATGSDTAHRAIRGSLDLDRDAADLYTTENSDEVGAKLSQIASDRSSEMYQQGFSETP